MKGIVFTEFLGFVADHYGDDAVDDIIEASGLRSGGAYTAVGTYDHGELVTLCQALAEHTGEPAAELIKGFGFHLSGTFARGYPDFFARSSHFFDFLESVEAHIHKEVHKLYPDAELPTFTVHERSASRLAMDYRSPRRMGALAEGLITGTARRFGVEIHVQAEPLDGGDGQAVRFVIDLA
ncbi:MAG: heme NO-binding domain-containing protein [Gammaproteobacteria bacterium]